MSNRWRDHGPVPVQSQQDSSICPFPSTQVPLHSICVLPVQCAALHQGRSWLWWCGENFHIIHWLWNLTWRCCCWRSSADIVVFPYLILKVFLWNYSSKNVNVSVSGLQQYSSQWLCLGILLSIIIVIEKGWCSIVYKVKYVVINLELFIYVCRKKDSKLWSFKQKLLTMQYFALQFIHILLDFKQFLLLFNWIKFPLYMLLTSVNLQWSVSNVGFIHQHIIYLVTTHMDHIKFSFHHLIMLLYDLKCMLNVT